MQKPVKLRHTEIKTFERYGLFNMGLRITGEKMRFDQNCNTLLKVFAKLAKKNKLPENANEIMQAIAQSYKHSEQSFKNRQPTIAVLDVDYVLEQLI